MDRLNKHIVSAGPAHDNLPVKVLQFGEGNFLRAFMDWMIDGMNANGLFNGRVSVVQPIEHGMIDVLNEQDGRYTLLLRGVQSGSVTVEKNIVTSIARSLNPYTDFDSYLREAENPDLRVIISNTTEAGIELRLDDRPADTPASSFPGKLLQLLKRRYDFFNGDLSKGFLIFPCELIERNGSTLKQILSELSADWYPQESAFQAWLTQANVFFTTLVDRIVSGYPKEEAEALCNDFGYEDKLIVTGEIFHFLAIEGPIDYEPEFPLVTSGFDVKWCDDLTPYRTRKVRILNGAHTMTVLAAHLYGLETVKDCMDDPVLSKYIRKGIFEEIIPSLTSESHSTPGTRHPIPREELEDFGNAVLERFSNPYIRHLLLSISLNSVSKFKTRVLPSLLAYHERMSQLPELLTFSLAALILFYRGQELGDTSMRAVRAVDSQAYEINDSPEVLEWFFNLWSSTEDPAEITAAVLSKTDYWGADLNDLPGLTDKVANYLDKMIEKGVPEVTKQLVEKHS